MEKIERNSPVVFKADALKTETRNNWEVIMEYKDEGEGPYLVDLSHKSRFDLQDSILAEKKPFGIDIPDTPGRCILTDGILINRMNKTQASFYHLGEESIVMPQDAGFTDVTESTLFVALLGKNLFAICEKLTALDFTAPERKAPFLFQGAFSHVPCQIVTLKKDPENSGLVLTCSRGYGKDMIHSILAAGEEFGLRPAGENRFNNFIKDLKLKK